MSDYDVIIIGSGAGGGTLAHSLAPSGKRILVLERGGWLPRELENWDAEAVFVENEYVPEETWYDGKASPSSPVHYWVGGATKLYGAALYRLRKEDFGELQHHDGISPAWPISYEDMEPYYTQAEQLYQVHGARGEDPTEPPASAPYPFPALSHEPRIQQLSDDLEAPAAPVSRAQRRHAQRGRTPSSAVHSLPDVRRLPVSCPGQVGRRGDRRPARARLSERDPADRRTGGQAQHRCLGQDRHRGRGRPGRRDSARYSGDIVVVACGAANSAKLLLQSANDQHPNGLANGSDQVGRNYMFHASIAMLAISKEPNPTKFQKTLGLNDFYFGCPASTIPMGNIQMVGKSTAPMYRGEKPMQTALAPMFSLDDIARHAVDFWLSTEDLPEAGQPRHRRRRRQHPAQLHAHQRCAQAAALRQLKSMLSDLEMREHLVARNVYIRTTSRSAASPTRLAPAASARDPPARCSTPTARRTSWTTSTSSIPASSRASAQSTRRSRRWRTRCGWATTCSSGWGHHRPKGPPVASESDRGRRRVVIVGEVSVGSPLRVRCDGRTSRSSWSIGPTTSYSNPCSTRSPPGDCRRASAPPRSARCLGDSPMRRF